jgi:protein-L-isoaspartate(D-aspartate) O-methyltransferase
MNDFRIARSRMVAEQLHAKGICDSKVLAAMREVPRHVFVPRLLRHRAYQPCALPIGYGQTISQPFTVGLMTALLELKGREHVLEIGTGSGYQAAVLSRLSHSIVTVERVAPLARRAAASLAELGYENVSVLAADGSGGLAARAPFDAIVVTACAREVPEPLLEQLKTGGVLLLPMGYKGDQVLYRYRKRAKTVLVERSVSCRFVPLQTGQIEGTEHA